ncbi:hypothetical protein FRC15_007602 [Serendipita sp. 397]|nr:hypothetical protein FRC15_007602 [Serendipita sp. 397]
MLGTGKLSLASTGLPSKYGGSDALKSVKSELITQGFSVLDDIKSLETYGFSPNSYHPASKHSLVVKAFTTEDVVKIVTLAKKYRIPLTPFSGGTSLEGHFVQ